MTPPDEVPEAGRGAEQAEHRGGPPAVADFSGLDADDASSASVATFDDLDDASGGAVPARQDPGTAEGRDGDHGPPEVRVASFDGRRPRSGRSSGPRSERSRTSARRGAAPDLGAPDPGAAEVGAADVGTADGPGADAAGSSDARPRRGRDTRSGGPARGGRGGGGLSSGPQDDEARAKEICLRLLTDRARTVQELSQALRRKEIPDEVAQRVLERFDEVGLVDDEAFAGQWVRSRHKQRGLGRRAIAAELHRKGVAKEIADEALTEIDAESEEARARELVDRKLRTVPIATKEQRVTAARRLVGMLARKGYGGNIAYRVVKDAIAAHGAEEDELGEGPLDD